MLRLSMTWIALFGALAFCGTDAFKLQTLGRPSLLRVARRSAASSGRSKIGMIFDLMGKNKDKETDMQSEDITDQRRASPFAGGSNRNAVQVVFSGGFNTTFEARPGQPLSEVAFAADVYIPYKCRKGECGTCQVMHEGKWIKTCQTKVPSLRPGEAFEIYVRPAGKASAKGSKKPSAFFSPASFMEGVVNNGLGVVGFVSQGLQADGEFDERMEMEKEIEKRLAERKAAKLKEKDRS
uniref:2Fe-2S ferredoxin-type domain-containing protein n=1 Tax=Chromera velia CCMP2878 TaxID=1169474 RepID=A0A0G4FUS8_9ALVE|mmetsp:Transcript_45532/g.89696  ORF Transcript_45532/g.89696 Transcript_45532/m.89696 type:complete len:238 (-) Transcript_45532:213-926(-)|eukprot:Cvel_3756.t1-p1 / transcript=Cvel_3756.t1 / gene=Cvel_3756 / organism=Chromera_velia_CCMP2878 / gene_product=hypothetical protein / transcript_product=hypothetical protein / location=Cvel_scaffold157:13556-14408(-) / protein_length=237 / sequence_SO=supercontig / SO=protein_coding / is_pseudo=false